jgi:hypothetical protein
MTASLLLGQLVKAFRGFIKQREQESQLRLSPEERISLELFRQTNACSEKKDREISKERDQFFSRLKVAWDSLIYDRIQAERPGEWSINVYWGHTDDLETVKLTHPLQVRILDALTEAVGIPHQRGQAVIEIPKNLEGDKKAFLELVAFSKKHGKYP